VVAADRPPARLEHGHEARRHLRLGRGGVKAAGGAALWRAVMPALPHCGSACAALATDGTVTDGPYPESKEHLGGFAVVDVPSREEVLEWIAVACRCAQGVRELLPDPTI
jgi:YCII-related domain